MSYSTRRIEVEGLPSFSCHWQNSHRRQSHLSFWLCPCRPSHPIHPFQRNALQRKASKRKQMSKSQSKGLERMLYIYTMYLSMCTLFVHNLVTVPKLLLRLFFILFLIFLGFCCFLSVFPQSSALSQSGVAELIHGQFPGGRKIPYTQVNKIDMITIAAESSKDSSQFNKQNANIC